MATATKTRGKTKVRRRTLAPKRWRPILTALPGYDPFVHADDCWFDPEAADYYIDFIENCCTHVEGPLSGSPFLLELWEKAIVANLFGWYRHDEMGRVVRRYKEAFIYVPRKNGKSPLAAAISNAVLFLEEELGLQCYCLASETDQAGILFRHMSGMVTAEPHMDSLATVHPSYRTIVLEGRNNSFMKVLSGSGKHKSGRNSNLVVVDELHEIADRDTVVKMTTSTASQNRLNTLIIYITTADYDRPSLCNEKHKYACQVRDNKGDRNQPGYDPAFLPVLYEAMHADKDGHMVEDDWTKPAVWARCNPNLGVSVSEEWFRREVIKAQNDPVYAVDFKRFHLNIKTGQAQHIIDLPAWDACQQEIDWNNWLGGPSFGALDIGSWRDFCAFTLVFPHADGEVVEIHRDPEDKDSEKFAVTRASLTTRTWFWLPQYPRERDPAMTNLIDAWSRQGFITRTAGDEVDYDQVASEIVQYCTTYGTQQVAVDPGWQAHHSAQDLMKHLGTDKIVQVKQGVFTLGAPFRELRGLMTNSLESKKQGVTAERRCLWHDGNPVMRWMAGNTVGYHKGSRVSPDKDRSAEKIDGIVTLTMATLLATTAPPIQRSVYEERGIITI